MIAVFAGIIERWDIDGYKNLKIPPPIYVGLATIPFFFFFYYVVTFNTFIDIRKRVLNAWANVDLELKFRRDLVPSLAKVAATYLKFESAQLENLVQLKNSLMSERRLGERIRQENALSQEIRKITLCAEQYADLKDDGVIKLMRELEAIEEKIAHARAHFNSMVKENNDSVKSFPSGIIAQIHDFRPIPFYGEDEINSLGLKKQLEDESEG